MKYILALLSFAALAFGNQKIVDSSPPRGVCADCNCNGPRGDRGEIGDQGVQGQPGKQGPNGFSGAMGQMQSDVFYGTFILDSSLSVEDGDVALSFSSAINGPSFDYTIDTVQILETGVYQCWYSANTVATVKVYLSVNGIPAQTNTVFGQDITEANSSTIYSNFYGQAIISLQEGDVLQVRMYSSGLIEYNMNAMAPTLTMIKLS